MNAFLIGGDGDGFISYSAVVTREYPLWQLTVTGGDLPESGHVMTGMSYARLKAEVEDWLHWHQFGATNTYGWPAIDDDLDEDSEDDQEDDGGEGYEITFDCRWPEPVKDAEARFWAASKALEEARAALGKPICEIADGLLAEPEDVASIVHLPVRKVERIMQRQPERERYAR